MYAVATILMVMWSVGCVLLPLWVGMRLLTDREFATGAAWLLLILPLGVLIGLFPWAAREDMQSPNLVTLKKHEWVCAERHRKTGVVPVSNGKSTVLVPQTRSICVTYSKVG